MEEEYNEEEYNEEEFDNMINELIDLKKFSNEKLPLYEKSVENRDINTLNVLEKKINDKIKNILYQYENYLGSPSPIGQHRIIDSLYNIAEMFEEFLNNDHFTIHEIRVNALNIYEDLAAHKMIPDDFDRYSCYYDADSGKTLAHEAVKYGKLPNTYNNYHDEHYDHNGNTVAHIAALHGNLPDNFNQWDLKNDMGETVAHYYAKSNHKYFDLNKIKDVLDETTEDGVFVYEYALMHGNLSIDHNLPTPEDKLNQMNEYLSNLRQADGSDFSDQLIGILDIDHVQEFVFNSMKSILHHHDDLSWLLEGSEDGIGFKIDFYERELSQIQQDIYPISSTGDFKKSFNLINNLKIDLKEILFSSMTRDKPSGEYEADNELTI